MSVRGRRTLATGQRCVNCLDPTASALLDNSGGHGLNIFVQNILSSTRIRPAAPTGGVRALSSAIKTLKVLELLGQSRGPMTLGEVAAGSAMTRSSAYQKLITLRAAGWVEPSRGGFRLSLLAARIGNAALEQASLGERVVPILRSLVHETGETASLAVLEGTQCYIVQRVEAEGVVRIGLRTGSALSLDRSASGLVLTAFSSSDELAHLSAAGADLASNRLLAQVRRERFAASLDLSRMPDVRAAGVPVFDAGGRCLAALSLVGPVNRFDPEKQRAPLAAAAARIEALLAGKDA
ncbi:MAG: IclR family transcriptional regulator [Hyphomicrobiales bacterium]